MRKYLEKIYESSKESYYEYVANILKEQGKKFIITVNPEIISHAKKNDVINKMLLDENVSKIPDGISIVKVCRMYKLPVKERITGIDLMSYLLEEANRQKKSIYLFGAKKEIVNMLSNKIKESYPSIKLLGYSDGYVKDKNKEFKKIIKLKPDICFVALGVPEQELLIYNHINDFKRGIFVGVGGSFDVLSGSKNRAPKIFIKTNTEWLYRLIKEPKRIKRFWNNNIKFIIRAVFNSKK